MDDDIQPLCANLWQFKRLEVINLVSRGMFERGVGGAEWESEAVVEIVKWCCG
jgi:hypothetical protein